MVGDSLKLFAAIIVIIIVVLIGVDIWGGGDSLEVVQRLEINLVFFPI